jgi:hypothetical protein
MNAPATRPGPTTCPSKTSTRAVLAGLGLAVAAGSILGLVGTTAAGAAVPSAVGLGTTDSFAGLAGSTITNTGPSVLHGSAGLSPGSAVTGFPPGLVLNGSIHAADGVALQAKADLVTAYNDAAGRATDETFSDDLGGKTLVSGVYGGGGLGLTGTLTLDAQGNPNSVFIFQAASTLITASSSNVALVNGAQACNVFWQVGSSATLGTASTMRGTVMALTSISATTGATIEGRLLARNGALTLDTNVITESACDTGSGGGSSAPGGGTDTTAPGGGGTDTGTAPGGGTDTTAPGGGGTDTGTAPGGGTASPTGSRVLNENSSTAALTTAPARHPGTRTGQTSAKPKSPSTFTTTELSRTGSAVRSLTLAALFALVVGTGLLVMARRTSPKRRR